MANVSLEKRVSVDEVQDLAKIAYHPKKELNILKIMYLSTEINKGYEDYRTSDLADILNVVKSTVGNQLPRLVRDKLVVKVRRNYMINPEIKDYTFAIPTFADGEIHKYERKKGGESLQDRITPNEVLTVKNVVDVIGRHGRGIKILDYIGKVKESSIDEIATVLELPTPSTYQIICELMGSNIVVSTKSIPPPGRGRATKLYKINPRNKSNIHYITSAISELLFPTIRNIKLCSLKT